jgi:sRNA-binding protein
MTKALARLSLHCIVFGASGNKQRASGNRQSERQQTESERQQTESERQQTESERQQTESERATDRERAGSKQLSPPKGRRQHLEILICKFAIANAMSNTSE